MKPLCSVSLRAVIAGMNKNVFVCVRVRVRVTVCVLVAEADNAPFLPPVLSAGMALHCLVC